MNRRKLSWITIFYLHRTQIGQMIPMENYGELKKENIFIKCKFWAYGIWKHRLKTVDSKHKIVWKSTFHWKHSNAIGNKNWRLETVKLQTTLETKTVVSKQSLEVFGNLAFYFQSHSTVSKLRFLFRISVGTFLMCSSSFISMFPVDFDVSNHQYSKCMFPNYYPKFWIFWFFLQNVKFPK